MDSFSNRSLNIVKYIESLGIDVNIGKNKARGNKGFFRVKNSVYRIDIAKNLTDEDSLKALIHEFVHYIHFCNDKKLNSLEFVFGNDYEKYEEELISLTVDSIPKTSVKPFFEKQEALKLEIKKYKAEINNLYSGTDIFNKIEKKLNKTVYKHLLKHDRVRVLNGLSTKIYSVDDLNLTNDSINEEDILYLKLLSKKRALRSINSKVSKLNKYYSSPTELFARSFEYYFFMPDVMQKKAPNLMMFYDSVIKDNKIPLLSTIDSLVKTR